MSTPRRAALALSALLLLPLAAAPAGASASVVAALPSPRFSTAAAWDGSSAYVFGGQIIIGSSSTTLNEIVRYTPSSGSVTTLAATLPMANWEAAAVWAGGNAYVLGGRNAGGSSLNSIVRFTPSTGAVTTLSATLPHRTGGASAVWTGSSVFLFGGWDVGGSGMLSGIVRFTPSTGAVSTMAATLPSGRTYTTAAWDGRSLPQIGCSGGCAYVFGGYNGNPLRDIVRYNPATDTATVLSTVLPLNLHSGSAVWDSNLNLAYILGGCLDNGCTTSPFNGLPTSTSPSQYVLAVDPLAGVSTVLPSPLPDGVRETSAVWTGSEALLFGGISFTSTSPYFEYQTHITQYSPP
jgi:hypothetical protein